MSGNIIEIDIGAAGAPACILGVDPGLGGAIAFYYPGFDRIAAEDMPTVGGDVDAATLSARIAQIRPDLAIVELVASRPGQGVASMFKFGCGFGIVRGVIAAGGVPMHLVTPAKWKRSYGLDSTRKSPRDGAAPLADARRSVRTQTQSRKG